MPNKLAGYILIYVIGILIFLGVVGLGVAYTLRINAQLVLNEKAVVRNDYLLESAAQYTLVQLIKARMAETAIKTMDSSVVAKLALWKKGGQYRIRIQHREITVLIEEAGDLPDINVLTKEEIQRIFESLGASKVEAVILAGVLVKARETVGSGKGGGFSTLRQVLSIEAIPARYRFGAKPEAESLEAPPETGSGNPLDKMLERALSLPGRGGRAGGYLQLGLDKLFTVGTGVKTVDPNRAPLPVIFALVKTDAAALAKFEAARKTKILTLTEATQILGESARPSLHEGVTPLYRVRLFMEEFGRTYGAIAIVSEEGKDFKMLSYRISQPGDEQ